MIVNCPRCGTSHSKRDEEVADGLDTVCRDCDAQFHIAANGKVTVAGAAEHGSAGAGFDNDRTDILSAPDLAAILGSAPGEIATNKEPGAPVHKDLATTTPKRRHTGRRPSTGVRRPTGGRPGFARQSTQARKPTLAANVAGGGDASAGKKPTTDASAGKKPTTDEVAGKKPTTDEVLAEIKDSVHDESPPVGVNEGATATTGSGVAAGAADEKHAARSAGGGRPSTGRRQAGRRSTGKGKGVRRPSMTGREDEEQARTAVIDLEGLQSQLDAMKADAKVEDSLGDGRAATRERRPSAGFDDGFDDSIFDDLKDLDRQPRAEDLELLELNDDLGLADDATDVLDMDKLRGKLNEMAPAIAVVEAEEAVEAGAVESFGLQPSAPRASSVPGRTVDRWGGLRELPSRGKLIVAGLAVAPALLTAVLLSLILVESRDTVYLNSRQGLRPGPEQVDSAGGQDPLPRGAALTVFETAGELGFVRDVSGHGGYVRLADVLERAPASDPEYEFADCRRSFFEASAEICLGRAQAQFASCRAVCEPRVDQGECLDHCQARLGDCAAGCEGRVQVPAPAPQLEEHQPEPEPAIAADTPEDTTDAKEPRKGKRRKRRKRKR